MADIHPSATVDSKAQLDDDVRVGPNCVIEADVRIGSGTILGPNVFVDKGTTVGKNNQLFANSVIGGFPQMLGWSQDHPTGTLVMGDGNTIRENVTLHRSMHPGKETRIGNGNLIMAGAHVGHDCIVEDQVVLTNLVQLSGHCKMETGTWLSGLAACHQFVTMGRWSYSAGMTSITHDVPPFVMVSGSYPTRVRAVNLRGARRAGLSEEAQQALCKAFKQLYRSGGSLLENTQALAQEEHLDPNVQDMIKGIQNSSQHRYGRYLELFRD